MKIQLAIRMAMVNIDKLSTFFYIFVQAHVFFAVSDSLSCYCFKSIWLYVFCYIELILLIKKLVYEIKLCSSYSQCTGKSMTFVPSVLHTKISQIKIDKKKSIVKIYFFVLFLFGCLIFWNYNRITAGECVRIVE